MIKIWKKTEFNITLKETVNARKTICGISAGAVCWFNFCNSDNDNMKFDSVNCFNWFDALVVSHCDKKGNIV